MGRCFTINRGTKKRLRFRKGPSRCR